MKSPKTAPFPKRSKNSMITCSREHVIIENLALFQFPAFFELFKKSKKTKTMNADNRISLSYFR